MTTGKRMIEFQNNKKQSKEMNHKEMIVEIDIRMIVVIKLIVMIEIIVMIKMIDMKRVIDMIGMIRMIVLIGKIEIVIINWIKLIVVSMIIKMIIKRKRMYRDIIMHKIDMFLIEEKLRTILIKNMTINRYLTSRIMRIKIHLTFLKIYQNNHMNQSKVKNKCSIKRSLFLRRRILSWTVNNKLENGFRPEKEIIQKEMPNLKIFRRDVTKVNSVFYRKK